MADDRPHVRYNPDFREVQVLYPEGGRMIYEPEAESMTHLVNDSIELGYWEIVVEDFFPEDLEEALTQALNHLTQIYTQWPELLWYTENMPPSEFYQIFIERSGPSFPNWPDLPPATQAAWAGYLAEVIRADRAGETPQILDPISLRLPH